MNVAAAEPSFASADGPGTELPTTSTTESGKGPKQTDLKS